MKYRTKDGDVLDAICAKHYGDTPHQVEDVLAANPGLAALGPVLPSGLIINLPEIEDTAQERPTIRLWD
ncbi:tail protein X [Paracoccus jiaweipingae]|uniref:tail protein X n=1 Tax=unclassified Paracoccus (in: a-proteobacteria) TaxID=2688777 RepID=UPI0037B41F73